MFAGSFHLARLVDLKVSVQIEYVVLLVFVVVVVAVVELEEETAVVASGFVVGFDLVSSSILFVAVVADATDLASP